MLYTMIKLESKDYETMGINESAIQAANFI
jgi:hypothetical protein